MQSAFIQHLPFNKLYVHPVTSCLFAASVKDLFKYLKDVGSTKHHITFEKEKIHTPKALVKGFICQWHLKHKAVPQSDKEQSRHFKYPESTG